MKVEKLPESEKNRKEKENYATHPNLTNRICLGGAKCLEW